MPGAYDTITPFACRGVTRLAADGDRGTNKPAHRCLVMGDLVHRWHLLTRSQDPDRDRVAAHIKTEMDQGEMGDTGHGRLLPYVGSARSVWVTHADADRSRPFHADYLPRINGRA
jgi:hypothetical protein